MSIITTHFMAKDQTGIETSCQYLDAVLNTASDHEYIADIQINIEKARSIHEELRDKANNALYCVDETQDKLDNTEKENQEFTERIIDMKRQIKELEADVAKLELDNESLREASFN